MGADPATSVVDNHGQSHEVKRLYVGDSSLHPRTLSVNPSLTIMALACRLAEYLHSGAEGQLQTGREQLVA
jgi:choline dehydrogenase-like flavoprotein